MNTPFGMDAHALNFDAVKAFFSTAGDEGVTWEAKGPDPQRSWIRPEQVQKSVGGFANGQMPATLILGAAREGKTGPWKLSGVLPPGGDEPGVSLSKMIRNGLNPAPTVVISDAWPVGDPAEGRVVIAVTVEPVAEPPCITAGGQVFIRTSGETVPVLDPAVLQRLAVAGAERVAGAENGARQQLNFARGSVPVSIEGIAQWPGEHGVIVVAAQAVGYEPDIAARLFDPSTEDLMVGLVRDHLPSIPAHIPKAVNQTVFDVTQRQDTVMARGLPHRALPGCSWRGLTARWSGGVAALTAVEGADADTIAEQIIKPSAQALNTMLAHLGSQGRVHLVVGTHDLALRTGDLRETKIEALAGTWLDSGDLPSEEQVQRIVDELRRATGQVVWSTTGNG